MKDTLNKYSHDLVTLEGKTVTVEYSLPPLRDYPAYADAANGEEPLLLELLCKEEAGWADQFTQESIYEMLDVVGELMDPKLAAWQTRLAARKRKLEGFMEEVGPTLSFGTVLPPISPLKPDGASTKLPT